MDLAKRETPSTAEPQTTFRRETTLPRAPTDRPDREVNAVLRRPNAGSNAEALAKLLGVAGDIAGNIAGDLKAKQDNANEAQAAFDFASGNQNQDLYKNSHAYYRSWQLEGAKAKSLDIAQKAADKVQEVLNDPNSTAQDADAAIESVFMQETHDEKGNLLDFGTPEAKLTLAHSLAEVKAKLTPAIHAALKQRQDDKLLGTTLDNMVVERTRGAPIGDPKAASQDHLASIDTFLNSTGTQTPERAPTHLLGTLSEPFKGFGTIALTGHLGDQRAGHVHNGEDFPVPTGTSITAPMGGEVISSFNDTAHGGGETIRVKLANGAIVGFAHLSERQAKVGDKVSAGELLGLSGATGDATGPHVHMTVVVNGKHVSPREYFKTYKGGQMVVATGDEPQLQTVPATDQANPYMQPGLDVEEFLRRMPPSISKADAKTYFLQGVIAKAYQSGDVSLLNGLENSKKADGSPSFNPEEQLKIEQSRDTIKEHVQAETKRVKNKLQSDNLDQVLNAYNNGNPPSDSWLAAQGEAGLIDPKQAYTLISHNREMRKAAASEANYEARAQKQDQELGITQDVNSLASAMMAGVPETLSITPDELRQQFQDGAYGPVGSKSAMAHFRTLLTALKQGQDRIENSPDAKRYGAMLEQFKPLTESGANPLLIDQRGSGPRLDKPTYEQMIAHYRDLLDSGKPAGEAFREVVDKYVRKAPSGLAASGPPTTAVNRLAYLKCKQAGICK